MINVFVYGTLKPGEVNHWVCAGYVVTARPAIAPGHLYALPFGYPAMTTGASLIHGFVLTFDNAEVLNLLDEFEQHDPYQFNQLAPGLSLSQHCYERRQITLLANSPNSQSPVWAYLMSPRQVSRLGGVLVPDGLWTINKQRSAFSADWC